MMRPILLLLTCATTKEANHITHALLNKKLVVCVKQVSIRASFLWQGTIDSSDEILLIMESVQDKFDEIEAVVRSLHSYATPVLVSYALERTSVGVENWIKESLSL